MKRSLHNYLRKVEEKINFQRLENPLVQHLSILLIP